MNESILHVQVLVENRAEALGLLGEHGLSYLVQKGEQSLLFDTGQGMALAHNAEVLGVDLEQIDCIALSHGHYDHGGGLTFFAKRHNPPPIYAHPAAFFPKYAKRQDNQYQSVGIVEVLGQAMDRFTDSLVPVVKPTEVLEGVWLTGPVPRVDEGESAQEDFYLDDRGERKDELLDDQSLYFLSQAGVVVLLGCAHSGVINTLKYIQTLTDHRPFAHVMGGMHLLHASPVRIEETIEALKEVGVRKVSPCHCTGANATLALHAAWGEGWSACQSGSHFSFPL
ncbi:MAG: MBL fold metallo-hydrolase [bacterium]|jgi:7,8-dihydropterin-6-yl-methyl-4-(beta-D-ribofuranosyl)aminobenzene 5'-phosphate synthase|nr:MBL fold metallo-hydrolase [bacterium]